MAAIEPNSFLQWHSGAIAQKHAFRLCCFSHAVLPTDTKMQDFIEKEIISELLELAFHGRRTMEIYGNQGETIGEDPLWPASQAPKSDYNLYAAFGVLVHSNDITVVWEKLVECGKDSNPYTGRDAVFAGSVEVTSGKGKTEKLPIGAIVSAYIHFQNKQKDVANA